MKEPTLRSVSETMYSSTRDLGVLFEETEPTALNNNVNYPTNIDSTYMLSSRSLPPLRRARAGTMPSFVNVPTQQMTPFHRPLASSSSEHNNHLNSNITNANRHRSGSLNLSTPSHQFSNGSAVFGTPWSNNSSSRHSTQPPSPSTESLLKEDDDFSIARTLRSIGLEDEDNQGKQDQSFTPSEGEHHHHRHHYRQHQYHDSSNVLPQQQQHQLLDLLLSSSSSTANRSRSFSVNAATLHQESVPSLLPQQVSSSSSASSASTTVTPNGNQLDFTSLISQTYPSSFEDFPREQQRPRSLSMGRMEKSSTCTPMSSHTLTSLPWGTRRSPLGTMESGQSDNWYFEQKQYHHHLQNGYSTDNLHHQSQHYQEHNWQEQQYQASQINNDHHIHHGNLLDGNNVSLGNTDLLTSVSNQSAYNKLDYTSNDHNEPQWDTEFSQLKPAQSSPTFLQQHSQLLHYHKQQVQFQQQQHEHQQMIQSSMPPVVIQTATRSLWVGNIDGSVTVEMLTSTFSRFGPIESIRMLLEKECAFVNFFYVEDAIQAKDDILNGFGGRIGDCLVRIGFGKADMVMVPEPIVSQPTRALWLGNIPLNATPSSLHQLFSPYGTIESVRVLTQKKCGFINFEKVESAAAAKEALIHDDIGGTAFVNAGTKAGFAKVLPIKATPDESLSAIDAPVAILTTATSASTETLARTPSTSIPPDSATTATTAAVSTLSNPASHSQMSPNCHVPPASSTNNPATMIVTHSSSSSSLSSMDKSQWSQDLWSIMQSYGATDAAYHLVNDLVPSSYFESIPPVPELGMSRKFDAGCLRDIRKRLDTLDRGNQEIDDIANECMDEIAALCSDYIGNTVVQRFFEKCTEDTKTLMLKRIGPHLAAGGIHKNGTWAVQKIIDHAKTPEQIQLIVKNMKPYVPSLLLDQFGNYAVQCCLGMGSANNQFIFDAIVEKQQYIAQGRFGARAIRGILDNEKVTDSQRIFVAAALTQNATSLATNANGALILSWLIDSTKLNIPLRPIARRLAMHVTRLCTHKLGSQTLLKLVNHERSVEAQDIIINQLLEDGVLLEIMVDQARGLGVIHKLLLSTCRHDLVAEIHRLVNANTDGALSDPCYKKLLEESLSMTGVTSLSTEN